jgi:radical SAM family uncharacterized protein
MSEKIVTLYRTRLASEKGAVVKDWGGKLSVALVYPNHYRVGMSSLGFQVVYHLLNLRDDVVAERLFLPEEKEMSLHLKAGRDLLSLESQSPLQNFHIIAFSLSFENDYINILKILQLGRIPLLRAQRGENHPLIIGGGITSFLNPEPLADFFDLFLMGEAEANLNEFIGAFNKISRDTSNRQELLEKLALKIESLYVPSLYTIEYNKDGTIKSRSSINKEAHRKITPARPRSRDLKVNRSTIISPDTELADRLLIEVGRGCGRSCRFCAAGFVYRPPRFQKEEEVIECVDSALNENSQIGLLSASILDTPGIGKISSRIIEKGGTFSVSSLRADLLTEEMLEYLKAGGQKSVAIAPEAGSERLRRVINKHLTNKQILDAVRIIAGVGDFSIRLYFLIGLPTETMDDVADILDLVKSIKHHMVKESKSRGKIGRIKLSVNCFIPKASTPFQWFPMESVSSLKEKQKWLKGAFSKEGGVKITFDVPKWAYLQALLSMGDRRVASILLKAHDFDGNWSKAFKHSDLNPDFFVLRPKAYDEILPWEFIDHGINKEYLIKEYRLALKEKESEICRIGECDRCGVCKTPYD